MAVNYVDQLIAIRDTLAAKLAAHEASGLGPDYSNGPRSVQNNAWAIAAVDRLEKLNNQIAALRPDEIDMRVRAL